MTDNNHNPTSRGSSSSTSAAYPGTTTTLPVNSLTSRASSSSPPLVRHEPQPQPPHRQQQLTRIQPDQQSGRRASTKHGFVERFFRVTPTRNAAFITKLFSMVNEESTSHLIAWTGAGDQFTVFNNVDFSRIVLPKYFKHCNWSSFVRQLNMYDFHKINDTNTELNDNQRQRWDFKHPWFNKSGFDRLHKIRRKPPRNRLVPQIQYSSAMQLIGDPQANDDLFNNTRNSNHATATTEYVNQTVNTYGSNGSSGSSGENSSSRITFPQKQQRQPSMDSNSSAASAGQDPSIAATPSGSRVTNQSILTHPSSTFFQNYSPAADSQFQPQQQQQQQPPPPQTLNQSNASVQSSLSKLQTVAVSLESKLDTTAGEVNQLRKLVEDQQKILNELLLSVKYLKTKTKCTDDVSTFEEGEGSRKPRKVHECNGAIKRTILGSTMSAASVTNNNYYSSNGYASKDDVSQQRHPQEYQHDRAHQQPQQLPPIRCEGMGRANSFGDDGGHLAKRTRQHVEE